MEEASQAVQLIREAKHICLVPNQHQEPESIANALALFYTLKEAGKNVNVIMDRLPEKLSFLAPSLDLLSTPQNFVISIPRNVADVSQIYYEKTEENLKIHLAVDNGRIKKEHISFYFTQTKPDLVITIGIQDFQAELADSLDEFGFLLDAPLMNLDANPRNAKFGQTNIVGETSLSEATHQLISALSGQPATAKAANCLLAGLLLHYRNFHSGTTGPEAFQLASLLMRQGAEYHHITQALSQLSEREAQFLSRVLSGINPEHEMAVTVFDSEEFRDFGIQETRLIAEKIGALGLDRNILAMWRSHASDPMIKGFFYSRDPHLLNRFAQTPWLSGHDTHWVFLATPDQDIQHVKETIINLVT